MSNSVSSVKKDDITENNKPVNTPIKQNPNIKLTWIDKLVNFITGTTVEQRFLKKKLKAAYININKSKYKFYDIKSDRLTPDFAGTFYELYRISQHFSKYFISSNSQTSLKFLLIEIYSTEKQKELQDKLNLENFLKRLTKSNSYQEEIENIKLDIKTFMADFNKSKVNLINFNYNRIAELSSLINFDWLDILKKFNSAIYDHNITFKPSFEPLDCNYFTDSLISFNDNLNSFDFNTNLKNMENYIEKVIEDDTGLKKEFKKFMNILSQIKRDGILTNIIKASTKDPYFKPKIFPSNKDVMSTYLIGFNTEMKNAIKDAVKQIKKIKCNELLLELMGTTTIVLLGNYSYKKSDYIKSFGLKAFKYINSLNYLLKYLQDIASIEIKKRYDSLLLNGVWTNKDDSKKLSAVINNTNKIIESIKSFDEKCHEEGTYGNSIKKYAIAIKYDNSALSILKSSVKSIENEAVELLNNGYKLFKYIIVQNQTLINDWSKEYPKIVSNFKNLKWEFGSSFDSDLQKINSDIQKCYKLLNLSIDE